MPSNSKKFALDPSLPRNIFNHSSEESANPSVVNPPFYEDEHACCVSSSSSSSITRIKGERNRLHAANRAVDSHMQAPTTREYHSLPPLTHKHARVSSNNPFDGSYSFSSFLNIPISKEHPPRSNLSSTTTSTQNEQSPQQFFNTKRGRKNKSPPQFEPNMLHGRIANERNNKLETHACMYSSNVSSSSSSAVASEHHHQACITKPNKMKLLVKQQTYVRLPYSSISTRSERMHEISKRSSLQHTPHDDEIIHSTTNNVKSEEPVATTPTTTSRTTMTEEEFQVKSKLVLFFGFVCGMTQMHAQSNLLLKQASSMHVEETNMSGSKTRESDEMSRMMERNFQNEESSVKGQENTQMVINREPIRQQVSNLPSPNQNQTETTSQSNHPKHQRPARTSISIQELLNDSIE